MPPPKLTRLELQIMEALWELGACSIREIQQAFPEKARPAYTTVQTTVYRLEARLTLDDVRDAERTLLKLAKSTPRAERKDRSS